MLLRSELCFTSYHSHSSICIIPSSLPKNLGHCSLNVFIGLRARCCRLYMLPLCCCCFYPVCSVDFQQHFYVTHAFLWDFQAIIWTQLYGLIVRTYLCPPCVSWMVNFAYNVYLDINQGHGDVWCRACSELSCIMKWMLIAYFVFCCATCPFVFYCVRRFTPSLHL